MKTVAADNLEPRIVEEGELLWQPDGARVASSRMTTFVDWLADGGRSFERYDDLWQWSVDEPEQFWRSIWDFFEVSAEGAPSRVLSSRDMMTARWFPDTRLNYAEHLLRYEEIAGDRVALHHSSEIRSHATISWSELGAQVRRLAQSLRDLGIGPGDRVVSYMPNVPETAVAMMATVAIGAIWSSAAPEFGAKTVVDRFSQIEPKLIFVCDGYTFGGKAFDRRDEVGAIVAALPSLEHIVWLPYLDPTDVLLPQAEGTLHWSQLLEGDAVAAEAFRFERVGSEHPLWILFSSGTTGLPKPIVHSHVGCLLEHYKIMALHADLGPKSVVFFYSTTGWMMWNMTLSGLLVGAAVVLYDGSPVAPEVGALWRIAEETGTTMFGASPSLVQIMEKAGYKPGERHDLSALRSIIVGGAPSTPETFAWFYREVGPNILVNSQSGGTELCSAQVGVVPSLPVYAGEMQARLLGMDVDVWDEEGNSLRDEVGEMVMKTPFPSAPLFFWNDPGGERYRQSYFEDFSGIWRHGDLCKINARGGVYVYGRSDATLNRYGVRIGTAEIYRTLAQFDEVADAIIICAEYPDGSYYMPLYVAMQPGQVLDAGLRTRIAEALRRDNSPRHVPDAIIGAPGIPYTLTGKRMEVPLRRIFQGAPAEKVASRDVMANPAILDWYVEASLEHAISTG